ncbi:TspO/MBR family protein [Alkalibacterium putridalgicola]|uniref:TspO/MBR family protein n=1 Tax=Alkalibacterium putridalgicola TaxID=426703 RepID=UPI0034CF1B31
MLALTLIVNAMGAFGWINDMSQQEVSDMYPTLITPAPSTFSIWSVIYTFLIISIILMLIKHKDAYYEEAIEEISYLFSLSCLFNIIWIISFSYIQIGLSTLFIFAFLIVMVLIVKKVGKIQLKNRWLLPITFGLYSGWLFIATVVNISAWLVKIDWDGFGIAEEIWAIIILLVAVGLTGFVLFSIENDIFPLPIAWAYFGIYNKLVSPEGYQGDYTLLQYTVLIGIVLLIGLAAIQFYKNKYKIMPQRLNEKDASLN